MLVSEKTFKKLYIWCFLRKINYLRILNYTYCQRKLSMKITQNITQNNRTSYTGGWYQAYRLEKSPSSPTFDKKILERLKTLTADKVEGASLYKAVSTNLTLKDGTNITLLADTIQVTKKHLYQETVFPDGERTYLVPFSILKQDANETGGILPNIIEEWALTADADNTHEFIDASANLLLLFKQFFK